MLTRLKETLRGLRDSLSSKAEDSYRARDEAEEGSAAETYAEGEAHAYGVSSDEVRKAEDDT